jgi:farnesyl diphosphate synthase
MTIDAQARAYRERADAALERWLPAATTHPARLHAAIRYAVMGGGKRLRPLLAYASAEWLGLAPERVDAIGVALELVHAYSLVHDDLPALDDDDLRRGRPTTHIAFDEATAILVGDALQAHAYLVLATDGALAASAAARRQLVIDLAEASGSGGMAGGQAMDMEATGQTISAERAEHICRLKTGRLMEAAVLMPCRLKADADRRWLDAAARFGRAYGLGFQLADDLLDIEVPAAVSGKPQGSDLRHGKATLVSLLGAAATRRRLQALHAEALEALAPWGAEADLLRRLCEATLGRVADGASRGLG